MNSQAAQGIFDIRLKNKYLVLRMREFSRLYLNLPTNDEAAVELAKTFKNNFKEYTRVEQSHTKKLIQFYDFASQATFGSEKESLWDLIVLGVANDDPSYYNRHRWTSYLTKP
ncbi:hypothetical protein [Weissella confusa]|uniref:hypothetical protein n=1 Tax=Weissella confusa TaxID=1583 RepID=UPI00107FFD3C|nr:hypothetical protein [Weissella confusa]TGE71048.1 hypothetical protein C6P15_01930 [Weissella confusa]